MANSGRPAKGVYCGRMTPEKIKRERQKQDYRVKCAEVGGSVRDGYAMLRQENPERVKRQADAEIARWQAARAGSNPREARRIKEKQAG
jgi:hypothetical protein